MNTINIAGTTSIQNLTENAIDTIMKVFEAGNPAIVTWSGGKDSSTTTNLTLSAAVQAQAQGLAPKIILTHAHVSGIENPEMLRVVNGQISEIETYADKHGLDLEIRVSEPTLNDHWAVKTIGGRDLPEFSGVGKNRKCTMDMKIKPQQRIMKKIVKGFEDEGLQPVTILGTRFDESTSRATRMKDRGEVSDSVWHDANTGAARLSPIADWSTADVWKYLHACSRGEIASFSTFIPIIELYRDASDNTQIIDGVEVYSCRFGCCFCTAGQDRSMAQLLKTDPEKYGYMEGLHKLQKYMVNTQHDLERRQWVNFRITEDGYAMLRPNTYSPSMLEELLRMCLTLDVLEARHGRGRFQLIDFDVLVAIDAIWSLQGHHPAHHALRVYREVVHEGKLMSIPEVEPFQKVKVEDPKFVYVGNGWKSPFYRYAGLRDTFTEYLLEDCHGAMGLRTLSNGEVVTDVNTDVNFTVDYEAACMQISFELDHLIEKQDKYNSPRTSAFNYYTRMGIVALAKGPHAVKINNILKRTMWKEAHGLVGLDWRTNPGRLQELLDRSLSKAGLIETRTWDHFFDLIDSAMMGAPARDLMQRAQSQKQITQPNKPREVQLSLLALAA